MKIILSLIFILAGGSASATVVTFTMACQVKDFSSKVVRCGGNHPFSVPRDAIAQKSIKVNDVMVVNLNASEVEKIFSKRAPAQAN